MDHTRYIGQFKQVREEIEKFVVEVHSERHMNAIIRVISMDSCKDVWHTNRHTLWWRYFTELSRPRELRKMLALTQLLPSKS